MSTHPRGPEPERAGPGSPPATRRDFLKRSGTALAAAGLLAACEDDPTGPMMPEPDGVTLDFSSDLGVLNYAYALEQLEAAFYIQVLASLYPGATAEEEQALRDLRDHEVAHRDFLAAALGSEAIPALSPDFGAVDFGSRASVLSTARTFEDLGVSAYNGAGRYLVEPSFLEVAGKIVSVEARHASVVRTLMGSSFAPSAFDGALPPGDVLAAADPFIETSITLLNA